MFTADLDPGLGQQQGTDGLVPLGGRLHQGRGVGVPAAHVHLEEVLPWTMVIPCW